MDRVSIEFEEKNLAFDLDPSTKRWMAVEETTNDLLDEGDFPLVAEYKGKRYELYDDGTFAEVET